MAKLGKKSAITPPATQFTPVEIGGNTYQLSYSFNGLARAEALLGPGANCLEGLRELIIYQPSATGYRAILFAALHSAHPELTPDDAGNLVEIAMNEGTLMDLREKLLIAHGISFAKTDPSEAAPPAENSGSSPIANSGSISGEPPASTSA